MILALDTPPPCKLLSQHVNNNAAPVICNHNKHRSHSKTLNENSVF